MVIKLFWMFWSDIYRSSINRIGLISMKALTSYNWRQFCKSKVSLILLTLAYILQIIISEKYLKRKGLFASKSAKKFEFR